MTVREHLERDLGRPLRTGSLGAVDVERTPKGTWRVALMPGAPEPAAQQTWVRYVGTKRQVRELVAEWVQARQAGLGLDLGSYAATLPPKFGPLVIP